MNYKGFFPIIALLLVLTSCQKEEVTTMVPDPNPIDTTAVTVLKTGTFNGQSGYTASGTAQIVRDAQQIYSVRLGTDFKTSFATGSVTMYLSKNSSLTLSDATSLVKLAVITTNGQHDFPISEGQASEFKYVIVWCAPAGVQFGRAELK
jgi:hypothetical protein